jgi:hypothetical protein
MNVLPDEVTQVITRTAVTGQPWSLRYHVVGQETWAASHRALLLPPERRSSQQAAASVRRISV